MKNNNHVYLITHIPTGLQYVGMHLQHANIRFETHMCGFGSSLIYDFLQRGDTRDDFRLEILESCSDETNVKERETYWVWVFNTAFPNGLNVERATSSFGKYNKQLQEYLEKGWDLGFLQEMLICQWRYPDSTELQCQIDWVSKYQILEPIEKEFTEKLRQTYRQKYSIMETLRTNNEKFLAGRQKMKERMDNGDFTEAEKAAFSKKSGKQKEVWASRSETEKMDILSQTMKQYIQRKPINED